MSIKRFFTLVSVMVTGTELTDFNQVLPITNYFDNLEAAYKCASYEMDKEKGYTVEVETIYEPVNFLIHKFMTNEKPFANVPCGQYKVKLTSPTGQETTIINRITYNGISI